MLIEPNSTGALIINSKLQISIYLLFIIFLQGCSGKLNEENKLQTLEQTKCLWTNPGGTIELSIVYNPQKYWEFKNFVEINLKLFNQKAKWITVPIVSKFSTVNYQANLNEINKEVKPEALILARSINAAIFQIRFPHSLKQKTREIALLCY